MDWMKLVQVELTPVMTTKDGYRFALTSHGTAGTGIHEDDAGRSPYRLRSNSVPPETHTEADAQAPYIVPPTYRYEQSITWL